MSSEAATTRSELGNTGYELFVGALSILSIVNLFLLAVMQDTVTQNVVRFVDLLLSAIFLLDFLARMHRAESKSQYFFRRFGWADLLASLPFPQVKLLRIFRILRVARLLRRYGLRGITRSLFEDRAGSALLTLLFVGILVLQFGSTTILRAEAGDPNANIKTAQDALWYIIVTMSTVGYGDFYPVTTIGHEIGTVVIVIGVGIFGTLTGYLANLFLSPRKSSQPVDVPASDAQQRLAEMKELLLQQQEAIAALEQLLSKG